MRVHPVARQIQKLTESMIQETCSEMLELDGWRRLRTDPVSDRARGKGFGEPGMADDLFIRYIWAAMAEVMWIEWKSAKGITKRHQAIWHVAESARGATVVVAGEDFPKSIEGFQDWYKSSGLNRKLRLKS
jgi:hypothetical protein